MNDALFRELYGWRRPSSVSLPVAPPPEPREIEDWYVIGVRADGSELHLDGATSQEQGEAKREQLLRQGIEGYVAIRVEQAQGYTAYEARLLREQRERKGANCGR